MAQELRPDRHLGGARARRSWTQASARPWLSTCSLGKAQKPISINHHSYDTRSIASPDILARLPKLGETAGQEDPSAQVKFFYPDFDWTWYGIEFDGEDLFYGLVTGFEKEFGAFRLSELMENRGKLGPRDRARFLL